MKPLGTSLGGSQDFGQKCKYLEVKLITWPLSKIIIAEPILGSVAPTTCVGYFYVNLKQARVI